MQNCMAETEQAQASYMIYKMQKKLEFNKAGM